VVTLLRIRLGWYAGRQAALAARTTTHLVVDCRGTTPLVACRFRRANRLKSCLGPNRPVLLKSEPVNFGRRHSRSSGRLAGDCRVSAGTSL